MIGWIHMEYYEKEPVSLYLKDLQSVESFKSSKQSIQLFVHPWLGKILVINGEIQHIENYQTLYHELLVHLPIAFIPNVKTALILGGGSLFAAYEVLKYPTVECVVLCDHDHTVLELMSRHYPHAKQVLQDKRFHYVESDGREFIRKIDNKYDLIINDCFNLADESNQHSVSYFSVLSNLCSNIGSCVDIIYRHIFDKKTTIDTLLYMKHEKALALSLVAVPEYPGILHMETIWGNSPYIAQDAKITSNLFQKNVMSGVTPSPFRFFFPQHLPFYLYLPPYIKEMFNL